MTVFLQYDLAPILLGVLSALACGLVGNFLVLRRQSLMGDTISHVVLPGIVAGFLVAGTTATWAMMGGAGLAAVAAVGLIELVRRLARIETGAAMGVVFTTMFALGVLMLEQTGARDVHLDVEHALYGSLESAIWLEAEGPWSLLDPSALAGLPATVFRLAGVAGFVILFILAFWKELAVTSFDPAHADAIGISSKAVGFALVAVTAVAAVAAFEAVGSILVIAMFICPAATARMLTDSLSRQVWLSAAVAVASGVLGYLLAAFAPPALGFPASVSAAGTIALVAGVFQLAAMLFAPRYGALRRRPQGPN